MLSLTEPTLLLDTNKCKQNIQFIVEKAERHNLTFRPHFKTHQSHEIGRWFRDLGVSKITVSSLRMAEYFAQDGWADITVAFPVNFHEIERINSLAENITLNLLIVAPETVETLAKNLKYPVNIFIEIDCGDHRTGVKNDDFETIDKIISEIERFELLAFKGFLTHAGHSYGVRSDKAEINRIHLESLKLIAPLRAKYISQFPDLIMSYGDTPTCSVAENFEGIDEIRPGNLVFYDAVQTDIGSCESNQIAVAMACPIVAKYPERNEFVIYGGAVHFSKDSAILPNGTKYFGKVVSLNENGWESEKTDSYIKSLSQEHGVIFSSKAEIDKLQIGDFIGILPVHSCLTADVMKRYVTLDGEVIEKFELV